MSAAEEDIWFAETMAMIDSAIDETILAYSARDKLAMFRLGRIKAALPEQIRRGPEIGRQEVARKSSEAFSDPGT